MTHEIRLIQLFSVTRNFSQDVKLRGLPTCIIELDKDEYSVGDLIQGNVHLTYFPIPYYFSCILLAVDGKITSQFQRYEGSSRTWNDSISNLHLFTYLLRPKNINRYILPPSNNIRPITYPFSIKLPTTNLPGSFSSERGSIIYRVQVLLGCNGAYKSIGEKIFKLRPYVNIHGLTSIKQLADEDWRVEDGRSVSRWLNFKNIKMDGKDGSITLSKTEDVASSLFSFKTVPKLELSLHLPNGYFYLLGDEIPFIIYLKNPNGEAISKVSVNLYGRTIYAVVALGAWITSEPLTEIDNCLTPSKTSPTCRTSITCTGKIQIPLGTQVTSISGEGITRQPIIFQHILQVYVVRECDENGKTPMAGETLLGIGTTNFQYISKSKCRKAIIDLDLCKYPLGYTELSYPEDWDRMIKTGRFGYFENPAMEFGFELNPKKVTKAMSTLSLTTTSSCTSSRRESSGSLLSNDGSSKLSLPSTTSTMPPSYSGLSRTISRSTLVTPPPGYHAALQGRN